MMFWVKIINRRITYADPFMMSFLLMHQLKRLILPENGIISVSYQKGKKSNIGSMEKKFLLSPAAIRPTRMVSPKVSSVKLYQHSVWLKKEIFFFRNMEE